MIFLSQYPFLLSILVNYYKQTSRGTLISIEGNDGKFF